MDNFEKDSFLTVNDALERSHDANITPETELNLSKPSLMERFLALQQRRIEITQGSTQRRINELRATIVANVEQNLRAPDEMEALKQCNVDIAQLSTSTREAVERGKRKRKRGKRIGVREKAEDSSVQLLVDNKSQSDRQQLEIPSGSSSRNYKELSTQPSTSNSTVPISNDSTLPTCFGKQPEKRKCPNDESDESTNKIVKENTWQKIRPFLTVNDHLITTTASGRTSVASHLEEQLESAISARDMQKAEELSDRLATREFGIRIVGAIEAKKYADEKEREKKAKAAASKKKLAWGFVQKHRWETKGNM